MIPTGYSFNLDAFSIYLTLATVFIAQATNTPLAIGDLLAILGVALLTSKGAHGVPGSAIVVLAATLAAMPAIPAIGLVLILSVDWFIGHCARARQLHRQLRRYRRDRFVGRRHRPGAGAPRAQWRDRSRCRDGRAGAVGRSLLKEEPRRVCRAPRLTG